MFRTWVSLQRSMEEKAMSDQRLGDLFYNFFRFVEKGKRLQWCSIKAAFPSLASKLLLPFSRSPGINPAAVDWSIASLAVRNFLGSAFFQFQTAYSDSVLECGVQCKEGAFVKRFLYNHRRRRSVTATGFERPWLRHAQPSVR